MNANEVLNSTEYEYNHFISRLCRDHDLYYYHTSDETISQRERQLLALIVTAFEKLRLAEMEKLTLCSEISKIREEIEELRLLSDFK